ncbi:MAG: permease prefix domain 1-containing protein [Bacteroidota bacterium]
MEPTAPFDLTLALDGWLAQFRQKRRTAHRWATPRWAAHRWATPRLRPDDLEELQSHLLDQIDDLMAGGKSAEQAFQLAIGQLGEPDLLAKEYRKVHYWYAFRQKALAFSRATVTSRRIAAFSMLFVAITFGSIFGQKTSDKHGMPPNKKTEAVKSLLKGDTTQKLLPNKLNLLNQVP